MGSAVSKSTENMNDDFSGSNMPSVPISTPQIRKLDLDPRSPSSDIARTPIEVLKTPIARIAETNNSLNMTEDLSDSNEFDNSTLLDPRSPTTEFHRTPIITDAVLKHPIHNKNLDHVRVPLVTATPVKPKKLSEKVVKKIYDTLEIDTTKIVSPKLLESSPITVKLTENKRNSVVGLLETNIDFVETDLDAVIQNKILKNELLADVNIPHYDISKDVLIENYSNTINITDQSDIESDYEIENNFKTESPKLQASEIKTETLIGIIEETKKISDLTDAKNVSSIDELDRKLTNLIYEDKQAEASPKLNKPAINHRTPLGDRNSNTQQRKSIPILKVSDKPTKPSIRISRIPVFKEKKIKGKMNLQCENTPPRMKHTQWAAEDSLII